MNPHYTYSPGTDGCDATFDVYCDDTHLVSVHYWEKKQWAEALASLIAHALNSYDPQAEQGQAVVRIDA